MVTLLGVTGAYVAAIAASSVCALDAVESGTPRSCRLGPYLAAAAVLAVMGVIQWMVLRSPTDDPDDHETAE